MAVNLTDWLGTHLALLWLSLGVMLLALEWLRRDLTLAMLALGAAAAALVALILPEAWYVQLPVGVVAAIACLVLLRPVLLRAEAARVPASSA